MLSSARLWSQLDFLPPRAFELVAAESFSQDALGRLPRPRLGTDQCAKPFVGRTLDCHEQRGLTLASQQLDQNRQHLPQFRPVRLQGTRDDKET